MTLIHRTGLVVLLVLALAACKKEEPKPAEPAAEAPKTAEPAAEAPKPTEADVAAPAPAPAAAPTPAPAEPAAAASPTTGAAAGAESPAMKDPKLATEAAPATYKVKFKTTKGDFVVQVTKDWSPKGADRFYNLAKMGYFKDIAFFRVIPGFMAQFGIHGDPAVNNVWREASIDDDQGGKASNKRGYLTFAKKGIPNSRSVQFFINLVDNQNLDQMGFTPFGQVVEGMDVVDKIYGGYGEGAPRGMGPDQMRVQTEGNAYLKKDFPNLDYITSVELVP